MGTKLLSPRVGLARLSAVALLAALSMGAAGREQDSQSADDQPQAKAFGGKYADLTARQKSLIDDLYRRFSAVTGDELDPAKAYDKEPLSWRTTFEAHTHALSSSSLTDANGATLGTAIDLIDYIEAVHGKIKGTRGDHQFRIYVRLVPEARDTLDASQEFTRGHDNTYFHVGYPINYREDGTPSVQFSMVPDATRADIDVDYRSDKFPKALIDGHLTAGNSDIAAGNNLEVHDTRWSGLTGWWKNLFGLPLFDDTYKGEEELQASIPVYPRAGKEKIEESIHDFLTSWLVDGQTNLAAAYFSDRAYACMALEQDDPSAFDYGTAPFVMMARMNAVNKAMGDLSSLDSAIVGVRLFIPDFELAHQKYHRQFVVYGVPEHVAAGHDCSHSINVGQRRERRPKEARGFKYFATTFNLKAATDSGSGETLALLWTKEEGYWKIISYEVEPSRHDTASTMPNIGPTSEMPELAREMGDPALVAATEDFFDAWLVKKDYGHTFGYMSRRTYLCTNLDAASTAQTTMEAQVRRLQQGFRQISRHVGSPSRIEDALEGVEPAHVDARIVIHPSEQAYSLTAVSDWIGDELDCKRRVDGEFSAPDERAQSFGSYYLTTFRIKTVAGETMPLTLSWTKEDGEWRIVAYKLETP